MKAKTQFKKWLLPGLMGLGLLMWGIVTGAWGMVLLSAYLIGAFVVWVDKQIDFPTLIIFVMLPLVADKIQALEKFQDNAERYVIEESQQFERYILRSNTEEQLYRRGQDSEGFEIFPGYTPFTVQIKRASGQPTDRVTLFDTGAFYESFYIEWGGTWFEIYAKDSKTPKLAGKYGPEIFGLDDNSRQDLIDNLKGPVLERAKRVIL